MTKKELEENMALLLNHYVQLNNVNISDIEILEPISDRGFKVNIQTEPK
jgi:hypothetical protein